MDKLSRGRNQFEKYKKIINFVCKWCLLLPEKIRIRLLDFFRMTKGTKGLVIRYILLKTIAIKCGDNVAIHPNVYIFKPEKLIIGNNVSVHPMSYIDATGIIEIGNDVSIAHGVSILSSTHLYKNLDIPIKDQGVAVKKTKICDNVWIGAKATILYGRTLGRGSIIGANAVVKKDIEDNFIFSGGLEKNRKEQIK